MNLQKARVVLALVLFSAFYAQAQTCIQPTTEFTITGQVAQEVKFSFTDLQKMPEMEIGSLDISNHAGEKRGTASDMKGVLVKAVLKDLKFKNETPRQLSEFYLTFVASDGYKAVFSWNEIFNSPTGDHLYLVTEKAEKKIGEMDD